MNNKLIIVLVLLALYFLCNKKEGFNYNTTGSLSGPNNMVLTDGDGNLSSIQFPKGIIVIWNGLPTNVPSGWALCDGNNGTPNLKNKFVLGVDQNSNNRIYRTVGEGAGSETTSFTLTMNQMPPHNHDVLYTADSRGAYNANGNNNTVMVADRGGSYIQGNVPNMPLIKNTGGGQPVTIDNMPPYLVLAYIMKL
jgi:microcystin-dependent protein